ncbi:MAG: hypothetical protein P1V20_28040 [Verrucomicrobiales bacterium]|nr:hypothetical protein [Verrucomicrobiales bacterium]
MKLLLAVLLLWISGVQQGVSEQFMSRTFTVSPAFTDTTGASNQTARVVLESAGIKFPKGSSAVFNPVSSTLTVKNHAAELEKVSVFVKDTNDLVQKQVYVTTKVFRSEAPFFNHGQVWSTSQIEKSKTQSITLPKEAGLSFLSAPELPESVSSAYIPVNGIFTEPQFQVLLRALAKEKKFDLIAAPSVMIRNGEFGLCRRGDYALGVEPVIGADGYTLNLGIYLRSQANPSRKVQRAVSASSITIWSGQIVAFIEKISETSYITTFVKAEIQDPGSEPVSNVSGPPLPKGSIFKRE